MTPALTPPTPYKAAAAQLRSVHGELRAALASVLRHADPAAAAPAPSASLAEYTTLFSRFLLAHHHTEDTNLFPALRADGKLRTSDLTFLAGLERDHLQVHTLCDRLAEHCRTGSPDRGELHRLAADLQHLLLPHLATEETGLSAERLPHLVSESTLLTIQRKAQKAGGSQRQQVLKLLDHPLHTRSPLSK